MKSPLSIGLNIGCGIAAAMACAAPVPALAQTPSTPTAPPVSGPGSLNGVWLGANFKDYRTGPPVGDLPSFKDADGQPIPMLPAAAAVVAQRIKDSENGHPYAGNASRCVTNGMPSSTGFGGELATEFLETPNQVTILYEYFTTFRIIRLNQAHAADPDPTFMGDAVGRWEGDTLVVDTIAISPETNVMNLIPHSEDLHVVERIRRTGPETIENRITIEDPQTFAKPFSLVSRGKRVPGAQLREFVCQNNRNPPSENGTTGVKLQTGG